MTRRESTFWSRITFESGARRLKQQKAATQPYIQQQRQLTRAEVNSGVPARYPTPDDYCACGHPQINHGKSLTSGAQYHGRCRQCTCDLFTWADKP